jgi:glycine oxidase
MQACAGKRVVVAGAGAVGSVCALALARAGARVTLADPAPRGDNASGVAAGMLAPALEAALDPLSREHFDLLRRARDAWPAVLDGLGAGVRRCGALWFAAEEGEAEAVADRLRAMGAGIEALSAPAAERLSFGLAAPGPAIRSAEDWRLEPRAVLAALHRAIVAAGGEFLAERVTSFAEGRAGLSNGAALEADLLVLATAGRPAGLAAELPELSALSPIKGQIVRLDSAVPREGPIVRRGGVYVVPSADGPIVGATMEAGVADTRVDAAVVRRLQAEAAALFPALAAAIPAPAAGVRYGTPDGLPLVGASSRPDIFLALGARRNGWLLAPLMARAVIAAMAGTPSEPFRPGRFLA